MGFQKLGPVTIGIAGATGTSSIGIMASRLASGRDGTVGTCLVLAASFVITGFIAALGLILNYRLERLTLQARASAVQRRDDLRATQLELQRAVLGKIPSGTKAAHAYVGMTAADGIQAPNYCDSMGG